MRSLADVDVDAKVRLVLDVSLKVRHFEMVVHPVNNEVREPGVLPLIFE
jgi:hypothetical protein